MAATQLQPNDRYAGVGKTGSGKTKWAIVLAGTLARALPPPWTVDWLDTKNDPDDLRVLREWGARNAASPEDMATTNIKNFRYYYIVESEDAERHDPETVEQVQQFCADAYRRMHSIVVVDEYTQATPSDRNPGKALRDIFSRGRGRNVGIIGLTQEPVYVPRQLLSQATHQYLFSVSYEYDKDYLRKISKEYRNPQEEMGDRWGFWYRWVDGGGKSIYYPDQQKWYETIRVAKPKEEGLVQPKP
jgi:hypothetical protein